MSEFANGASAHTSAPSSTSEPTSAVNPYQPPSALEAPRAREKLDWKWLMFSFEGRIPRSKYWLASAIMMCAIVPIAILAVIMTAMMNQEGGGGGLGLLMILPLGVCGIFLMWSSLAVSVKRWHDRGKSGFWVLIGLVPYIGGLWAFIENGCLAGDPAPNQYGPPYDSL